MAMPVRVMDHWISRYQSVIDDRIQVLKTEQSEDKRKLLESKREDFYKANGISSLVKRYEKAKSHNLKIRKKLDNINKQCQEAVGDNSIVPADYPEPFKTKWRSIYSQKDWNASYPCNKDALLDFERFCEESGGFVIS